MAGPQQQPEDKRQGNSAKAPTQNITDTKKRETAAEVPGLLKYADFDYGAFLKRRNVRVLVVSVIVIAALVFGWLLSDIFVPLLTALMIAYILNPLVVFLQKRGMSRLWATATIFIGFFATTAVVLALAVPGIIANITDFAKDIDKYPAKIETLAKDGARWSNGNFGTKFDDEQIQLAPMIEYMFGGSTKTPADTDAPVASSTEGSASGTAAPPPSVAAAKPETAPATKPEDSKIATSSDASAKPKPAIDAATTQAATNGAMSALETATDIVKTMMRWLLFIALVPLYTFYFMLSLDRIWEWTRDHLPGKHRERIVKILSEIHQMASAFFRGRLTVCTIVAIATTVLLVAFDVPMAVLLGILGGFGVIIPFFPMIASLTPAVLLMLMNGSSPTHIAIMAGIFLAIQGLEQFVLTPRILGKAVELHPVTLMVGVFVMFQIFGFFGALLAVPLTCIAKILGREFLAPYFKALAAEKPGQPGSSTSTGIFVKEVPKS